MGNLRLFLPRVALFFVHISRSPSSSKTRDVTISPNICPMISCLSDSVSTGLSGYSCSGLTLNGDQHRAMCLPLPGLSRTL
ncbi:hypothetical protein L873DRAFT_352204 [Choiromyces venosus 120613-1]|uniref:Uncharacterized protein n=1 Tax=Choiromyces venosus 120613-1 TaxID=1336337 RepID=A0A3N4IYH7_9PEZI|nr:hypothetical protein L873DRAFT_352204 [Choiromyces venosus 120613-1]